MISFVSVLVLPLMLGFLFINLIMRPETTPKYFSLIQCFLSIGIGFGLTSCFTFFLLLSGGLSGRSILVAEILLTIVLCCCLFFFKLKRSKTVEVQHQKLFQVMPASGIRNAVTAVFWLTLVSSIVIFLLQTSRHPHGGWDAFAIWNLRARFLFRAGPHWRDAFSDHLSWSHPDYPLFLPSSIVRGWAIFGNDALVIPILLAFLFTFGIVGLTISSLSMLRNTSQGLLAGLVLLGTPFYITLGASQLADIPLAFFVLSTVVLLSLKQTVPDTRLFFLAGLSAGFSTWVKNEGSLFLLALIFVLIAGVFLSEDPKNARKQFVAFLLGVLPVLIVLILFKTHLSTGNDLLSERDFHSIVAKLTDPTRHFIVLREFERGIRNFGGWAFSIPIFLVFYALVLGLNTETQFKVEFLLLSIAMVLVFSGYYLVYILTPNDLTWHLQTSLNRLFMQFWPSALFCYFLLVRTPEEAATIRETQTA